MTNPPYDYRVQYLESTGTQYISTGLNLPTSSYSVYIRCIPTRIIGTGAHSGYSGVMGANGSPQIGWYTGGWTTGNAGSNLPEIPTVDNLYEIEYSKNFDGSFWVNDFYTGLTRRGNMTLNFFWVESKPLNSYVQIEEIKVTDSNGTVILHLIPVVKDSIGYMYDTINNKLYGNVGEGYFIIGPKV